MNTLERILRSIVLVGIFALPFICLLVSTSLFFPYITGKNFAFRIIVELIAGAWLTLALAVPAYRPRRSWILGVFALFTIAIAIADMHGAYPFKSLWSNFERMDGWITLAHTFVYFVVATSVIHSAKLWKRLFQTSLGVSVYVSVYGLLQVANVIAVGQGGGAGLSQRIDATFGNPIYLAVYMLFHIFIAAMLWAQANHERKHDRKVWLHWVYGSVIVLDTLSLFLTGTRGTAIGLVGGIFVSALVYLLLAEHAPKARKVALGVIAGVVIAAGVLVAAKDTVVVKNVGFLNRLATISLHDTTVNARFLNWGIAWQGVKERPLLGWGQENYAIVFDKYYDPRMYGQEPWFDRVHNSIFDWLIAGGFVGLILYLALFVATVGVLFRSKAFSVVEKSLLIGLIAGYFCHNLFVFDNVTSYILFATMLAYIVWKVGEGESREHVAQSYKLHEQFVPAMAIVTTVLTLATVYGLNYAAYSQNVTLLQALMGHQEGPSANVAYFKQALAYQSFGTQEAREQLIQIASSVSGNASVSADIKSELITLASSEMDKQAKESPLDARFPLFKGVLLQSAGDAQGALASIEKAHELSPKKQTILFQKAALQMMQNDTKGALATYEQAFIVDEGVLDARLNYAAALIRAHEDDRADTILAPVIPTGEADDTRILAAYLARHQTEKLVAVVRARITAHPEDTQAYLTLAAAYYQVGDSDKAIETLREVVAENPSTKDQIGEIIKQIQDGTLKLQ